MSLADGVNWIVAVDVNDEPFYSSRSASVPIAYDYLGNLEQDKRDCREGRGRLLWRAQEDGTVNISRMLFALPSMQYTGYVIINMDASVFYQDAHRLSNAGSIVFDSYGAPMLYNLDASMNPSWRSTPIRARTSRWVRRRIRRVGKRSQTAICGFARSSTSDMRRANCSG